MPQDICRALGLIADIDFSIIQKFNDENMVEWTLEISLC
jgi:hypothetical protein